MTELSSRQVERVPGTGEKTVLLGFDDVLASTDGVDIEAGEIGEPLSTALALLKRIKTMGFRIVIFSSRTDRSSVIRSRKNVEDNVLNIHNWLYRYGLRFYIDDIWAGDRPLGIIVDASVVQFSGRVEDVIDKLVNVDAPIAELVPRFAAWKSFIRWTVSRFRKKEEVSGA